MPPRSTSIAARVAVALVALTTLVLVMFGTVDYAAVHRRLWIRLHQDAALDAERLAASLALPVWNLDHVQIDEVIGSTAADQDVFAIEVEGTGRAHSFSRRPPPLPGDLIEESRPISLKGRFIGTVRMAVSPASVQAELRMLLLRSAATVVLLDAALILFIYLMLRRRVLHPLAELERYAVAVSSGARAAASLEGKRYTGELEVLRASMEKMVALLDARYAEITASENKYRALFHGSNDGIAVRPLLPGNEVTPFTEVNEVFCRRLGYSRDELLKMTPNQIDTNPERAVAEVGRQLRERGSAFFETVHRARDGRLIPVELNSHLIELGGVPVVLTVARDISERKRAEATLRTLSEAVQQSPVGIAIADAQGVIEYVNPRMVQITGYAAQELIGHLPPSLDAETGIADRADLRKAVSAGEPWEREFLDRRKNGQEYWRHLTLTPVRAPGGAVTHFLAITEDVTERRSLEEKLRQSQKMEAIGLLAGGVAHDFNNLLMVILGYAGVLRDELPEGPSTQRESLEQILNVGERAAGLTRSLLAFGRRQMMAPEVADVGEVVRNVGALLHRVIGEDIELRIIIAGEPVSALMDVGQIEHVLVNFATNSRDAMPAGGRLTIETGRAEVDAAFARAHGLESAGGPFAVLSVSDTGVGMDAATRSHIFEPFFTTKAPGKGTGLGLAIAYGVVQQHGGFINVYSEPGRGTTLRVYLPAAAPQARPAREAAASTAPPSGTETILVAEDEETVRAFVESVLKKYGYQVIVATDGNDAVAKFQANRDRIQFVLMDVIMPGSSGKKAWDEIRRDRPDLKVLFTSGYTADAIQSRGELDHGADLMMKPMQPRDLLVKIRQMLDTK